MGDLLVTCEINSYTRDERRRELVFCYNGASVRLIQTLTDTSRGVWYDEKILPSSDCSVCSSFLVEWVDDISTALRKAKWFAEKSRPFWEKHDTVFEKDADIYLYDCIHLKSELFEVFKDSEKELTALITDYFRERLKSAGKSDVTTNIEVEFKRS